MKKTTYAPAYVVNYGVNASHIMMVCSGLYDDIEEAYDWFNNLDTEKWKAAELLKLEFDELGYVDKKTKIEAYNFS